MANDEKPLTDMERQNRFVMTDEKAIGPILKKNATKEEREAFFAKVKKMLEKK